MRSIFVLALSLFTLALHAQFKQQLRGTVVDQVLQKPLAGATVTLVNTGQSVITDSEGVFRFKDLSVGSYRIIISYAGFKEASLDNIAINSGKETVLTFPLEALVRVESEVLVKSNTRKNKPLNDMSVVSARAFTVEETQKYAAAVNDPLRMAMAFPGVLAADDGVNNIIIRGNSPAGLLWKMEGMDIPNPNHFADAGSSGGGISILSSQLLSNSDFVTGAFAAEYGNGLSGVFDLKLRKGNNEKREYTLQAGVLGLNGAMEGPFSKSYKGSYLINYRYSTLELLNKVGVLPNDASTNFQDLSFNVYLPTNKLGTFTLFGFGGLSSEVEKVDKDSAKWESKDDRRPSDFVSNTSMTGITHTILLGRRVNLKSGLGLSYTRNAYEEGFMEDDFSVTKNYEENYKTRKWLFNSTMNYQFSNRLNMRAGIIANLIQFNYYQESREHEGEPLREMVNTRGNTSTTQLFMQWQYKPTNNFSFNAGLHYLRLALNGSSSVEPRLSAKWNAGPKTTLGFGYGLHSQLQALGVYFAQQENTTGGYDYPNRNLGFTKAQHYVVSFSQRLAKNLLFKTEVYYQHLFNAPVSTKDSSTFSTLNIIDDYVLDPLVNKGKGKNYGVEISIERYLQNNFYLTLTNSIYQSKYSAADGIERNTRFNGNYIATLITGKDFVSASKARKFGVNLKTIYAGGQRTTPIKVAESQQKGYTVFDEQQAYTLQNPAYFRTDLRVSITWNRRKVTSTLSLDIQNLTNRLNVYNQSYDAEQNKVITNYQTGLIPILNYKIEF